ncbi:MAG: hypothetical protein KDC38_14810 [Planctomycetes bacterium]|nr:hypothetical protein [Planctomycetota bacterium]
MAPRARPLRALIAMLVVVLGSSVWADREIGTNLATLHSGSTEWAFVDIFRQAGQWIPQTVDSTGPWDTGETLLLTPDGWPLLQPGQAAGVVIADGDGRYPAGQYLCLYDGTGTIEFHIDATVVSSQSGEIVIDVLPSNLIHLKIVATDWSDPVRNIRLIMPGFWDDYETQVFHPLFLERLAPYRVIRFMDWQRTNTTTVSSWSQRANPFQPTQTTSAGVALEHMIALANRTGSSPWFCIPHLADDDYVTQFATMVRDQLDPTIPAYIEYSNECWNGAFPQADHCQAQGVALGLGTSPFQSQVRYYSQRAVEIFQIFENVFGGTDRLVRVLGAQLVTPWVGEQVTLYQSAYQHVDALAVNPYVGVSIGTTDLPLVAGWEIADTLSALNAEIPTIAVYTAAYRAFTDFLELELISYEGGQHLVGVGPLQSNPDLAALFHATNRDEGMYSTYRALLEAWHDNGGGVFMHYHATELPNLFGSWGALEYQDQDLAEAPKFRALIDHSTSEFRRGDCNQDGTLDLSDVVFVLEALFVVTQTPSCQDACDSNDDGTVDLSDPIFGLGTLFTGGPEPGLPGSDCGGDPTFDALGCRSYSACP